MSVHYLQNYRIAAGFTQEQAAEAIDISVSTLQNWEQGHCPRTPALLHELLDFYNVTPLQRATLILALYMPENIPCIEDIQSISDYASLFTADFSSNRLAPYTDALSVLDARIQWLKCTLKFCKGLLNKQLLSLYNLNTAKSIDKLAKEYNLSICAEYSFHILCVNSSYSFYYPFGEYLAMPDKKTGINISGSEHLSSQTKDIPKPVKSVDSKISYAVKQMEAELQELTTLMYCILLYLTFNSFLAGSLEITYTIEMFKGVWKKITILPCKKSYFLPLSESKLEDIIAHHKKYHVVFTGSDSSASELQPLYCNNPYISQEATQSCVRAIKPYIHTNNVSFHSCDEWLQICKNNTTFQNFCQKARPGEFK